MMNRRMLLLSAAAAALTASPLQAGSDDGADLLRNWYGLVLRLVRHTATYSPPVAARAFGYLGVAAYETVAQATPGARSLAGQVNALTPVPARQAGASYDERVVLNATLAHAIGQLFGNTGPTGQRVLTAMTQKMASAAASGVADDVVARSAAHGVAIARHVLAWADGDGCGPIENMGFPTEYTLKEGPAHWVPTSTIGQQQMPLLPKWGELRTFTTANGAACMLPPPPAYSEDKGSAFYKEALEVRTVAQGLTPEQKEIARFWSDDPMLSPTPPGHWISIALQVLEKENASLARSADVLARLGMTMSDGFVACWHAKFEYDLVRPVTYIRRVIDKGFTPLLITPPFPEYPSGHSTQSGAAASVMAHLYGDSYAFDDATHARDGLPARHFASFKAAAEEAAISRLYGGIHFRAAIERGLDQGACVGATCNALKTLA